MSVFNVLQPSVASASASVSVSASVSISIQCPVNKVLEQLPRLTTGVALNAFHT